MAVEQEGKEEKTRASDDDKKAENESDNDGPDDVDDDDDRPVHVRSSLFYRMMHDIDFSRL